MTYFEPGTFKLQTSQASHSYQESGNNMRFELQAGDHWSGDSNPGVERSEIASYKKLEFGQTYTIHYGFMVEPGEPNKAKWLVLGQLHATEDTDPKDESISPPFEIDLVGERMHIDIRHSELPQTNWGNVTTETVYQDTQDIKRGQPYDIKIAVKFDFSGNGMLDVWRDGVQLVDYNGKLGYNDQMGPYWKHGVYRKSTAETIAVNYNDFSLVKGNPAGGTTDPTDPVPPTPVPPTPPVNAAPTQIGLSRSVVSELAVNGTAIGLLSAQDPNAGDTFSYTLLNNADGRFALDATGKVLSVMDGSRIDHEQATSHTVTVRVRDQGGLFHDQNLTIAVQNVAPERFSGTPGNDVVVGGKGTDIFKGGSGQDRLTGGAGADKLWGGAGADRFVFTSIKDSTVSKNGHDIIYDFSAKQRDRIDLYGIDANTMKKGNQAFHFIGEEDFHHDKAGELRFEKVDGGVLVLGDVNGDQRADMAIFLKGLTKVEEKYFIL